MNPRRGISVGLIVSLLCLALSLNVHAQAALGEMMIAGNVSVNRIRATSGSTLFSGSEIETFNPGAAIVNFCQGGGVLAIESNTRVNLSGSPHRLAAQVTKGTMTLRAKSPATVTTPQIQIESEADSAYLVAVSRQGTEVQALTRSVRVRAEEKSVIVRPGERYSSQSGATTTAEAQQKKEEKKTRKILGIVIPLILGAISLPVALAVAEGEKSPSISPTTPKP